MATNKIPLKFHFFTIDFTPMKGAEGYSNKKIIREIIECLRKERKDNENLVLFDRHENRKDSVSRELFMYRAKFRPREERIVCSLALLRKNELPKLKPKGEINLVPLSSITDSEIAEETRFVIDYSLPNPIFCVQFNYYGPRIPDIVYYLRQIAHKKLRLSKKTSETILMEKKLDETLKDFKNVLNLEIKFNPKNLDQLDTVLRNRYYSGLREFGTNVKPKQLKVEAFFRTPGQKTSSSVINTFGNTMFKDMLRAFKARPFNIDCFDNFEVLYEDENGIEKQFSLLGLKSEIQLEVTEHAYKSTAVLYDVLKPELDQFMNERYTK